MANDINYGGIILLKDSDILSESMKTINHNFEILATTDEVNTFKWNKYVDAINKKIDELKNTADSRSNDLSRHIDDLNDLLDDMPSRDDIQNQINDAIRNADAELNDFLSQMVGVQIGSALGGYAKRSELQMALNGLDEKYVASAAFDSYKADAGRRIASASRIVANSTFAKDENGKLLYRNGNPSPYETVQKFWEALSDDQKAQYDPNNYGLSDPDVVENFLRLCESTFMTVHTELSLIEQKVTEGDATLDMMTAINGTNGENIVAAIFMKANEAEGSSIVLNADKILLDANHKLAVRAGDIVLSAEDKLALIGDTFYIDSKNFSVDDNSGKVTINGDLTANTFKTNNNNTYIGTDGILHAKGADITGKIEAQSFYATYTNEDEDSNSSITKKTTIDGQTFSISAEGEVQGNDITNNAIYIKIFDTYNNSQTNGGAISDETLYGLPALCMSYRDRSGKLKEYMLSPASWIIPNASGSVNDSNMRWMPKYSGYHCEFNLPNSDIVSKYSFSHSFTTGGNNNNQSYLFRDENDRFITWGDYDKIYQFNVLNLGGDDASPDNITPAMLKNQYNLLSDANNMIGSYTTKNTLGDEGLNYAGSDGVQTIINSHNCETMQGYLPRDNQSIAANYSKTVSTLTTYGSDEIIKLMKNLLTYQGSPSNAEGWKTKYFSGNGGYYSKVRISGLDGNLPYSGNQTNVYDMILNYYPICTIDRDSSGFNTHSSGTKTILIKCEVNIISIPNTRPTIYMTYNDTLPLYEQENEKRFQMQRMEMKLNFNVVMRLSNGISAYDPNNGNTFSTYVEPIIKDFFESYPFERISTMYGPNASSSDYNRYKDFIDFSATLYSDDGITAHFNNYPK